MSTTSKGASNQHVYPVSFASAFSAHDASSMSSVNTAPFASITHHKSNSHPQMSTVKMKIVHY